MSYSRDNLKKLWKLFSHYTELDKITIPFITAFVLVRSCVLDYYHVPTSSEAPNLYRGDVILINKCAYGFGPLSLILNIGRLLIPKDQKTISCLYNNAIANSAVRAGRMPYLKWATPQVGHIVSYSDPRSGYNIAKRVVGVSGDTIEVRNCQIIRNGITPKRKLVGTHYYRTDTGAYQTYNLYDNQLNGTDKPYRIQVLPDEMLCDREYDNVLPITVMPSCTARNTAMPSYAALNGKDLKSEMPYWCVALIFEFINNLLDLDKERIYVHLIGDNFHGSSDSRHGEVIPHSVPEDWIVGRVVCVLFSFYAAFYVATVVTNNHQTWAGWVLSLPLTALSIIIAIPKRLDRVGLLVN